MVSLFIRVETKDKKISTLDELFSHFCIPNFKEYITDKINKKGIYYFPKHNKESKTIFWDEKNSNFGLYFFEKEQYESQDPERNWILVYMYLDQVFNEELSKQMTQIFV